MQHQQVEDTDWRRTALTAATLLAVWLTFGVELLSLFHALTPVALAAFWLASVIGLWLIAGRSLRPCAAAARASLRFHLAVIRNRRWLLLPVLVCGLIAGLLLARGLLTAPDNWDSLTYHLSRVMHWQQDRGLQFYATDNLRQLHSGPWAEMVLLHLHFLTGGDRLDSLVQWSAMLGSLIGVSYIVRLLAGTRGAQIFAVVIAATLPMGILQSTTTQNDYVVAFWLVTFAVFALLSMAQPSRRRWAVLAGASLGIALLAKPTTLLFAFPLAVWLGLVWLRRLRWAAWKNTLAVVVVALAINAPQFVRNQALFGSPLGPTAENPDGIHQKYTNDLFTPAALASNLARNIGLHLGTPIQEMNWHFLSAIKRVHGWLGIGLNDPRTTWSDTTFNVTFAPGEDTAGNPWQLLLIGAGLLLVLWRRDTPTLLLGLCLAAAFVLFCFVLKWQPWNSRLHLPLFVLGAAFAGAALYRWLPRATIPLLAVGLVLWAAPSVVYYGAHALVGPRSRLSVERAAQYFNARPVLAAPYRQASEVLRVSHCAAIGLLLINDDAEYPLWALTGAEQAGLTLQAVDVHNVSASLAQPFTPCALVDTRAEAPATLVVSGTTFSRAFQTPYISVYFGP